MMMKKKKKKFARLFGLLTGISAVVWMMRDRFISLTAAREPEPPRFRAAKPTESVDPSHQPSPRPGDDLQEIKGVGPVYEQALRAYGVRTFREMTQIDPAELAGHLGVPESKVADWKVQAASLAS